MTSWHKLVWSEGDKDHRRSSPLCGRVPASVAAATTDDTAVTCKWCRKIIDRAIQLADSAEKGEGV